MPNNLGMTDAEIIELLGGVTVVARYFEIKPPSVFGWLETGIPEVRLMALAPQLELRSNGRFSRKARWPETYAFFWPELAQAHADHAPDATELIAVATAAIEAVLHRAEARIDELKTDAQVELKLTSVEVRGEIEKDAHEAMERLAAPKAWDGADRRGDATAPASTTPWDGVERRKARDRRWPDVLEAPISSDAN